MLDKILKAYNKFFVIWVILAGAAAYAWPEAFIPMKGGMEWFFGLTMFGIGAVLQPRDFEAILRHWKWVLIGVIAQFSIMPLSAFLISRVFSLSGDFSLGLILTGSAPGAMASNVFCFLAGADVAYSVSLTTVSTLLSPVLTPLLTFVLAHEILEIPFWDMFYSVVRMVLLPLLAGFWVRSRFERTVRRIAVVFPSLSVTFIVFICALVIALNKDYLAELSGLLFFVVVLLNLCGLLMGYGVARLFKMDVLKRRALTIEIGMQNAGLGSVLALKHFNERTAVPAVLFVFICIFSASLLAQVWHRDVA